jgi:hypothetical protein
MSELNRVDLAIMAEIEHSYEKIQITYIRRLYITISSESTKGCSKGSHIIPRTNHSNHRPVSREIQFQDGNIANIRRVGRVIIVFLVRCE